MLLSFLNSIRAVCSDFAYIHKELVFIDPYSAVLKCYYHKYKFPPNESHLFMKGDLGVDKHV